MATKPACRRAHQCPYRCVTTSGKRGPTGRFTFTRSACPRQGVITDKHFLTAANIEQAIKQMPNPEAEAKLTVSVFVAVPMAEAYAISKVS